MGSMCGSCLCEYQTPIMLVIRSKRIGFLFRLIELLIIAYVAIYVCWYQRAYQDNDSVISSVSTKVKGNILTNSSSEGVHVWDVSEYVIPPQGENSFFVLTNMIVTPDQTQSSCPEIPSEFTICKSDSDCKEGFNEIRGNGVQTGRCVQYSDTIKTCEVMSWCPLEHDTIIPKPAILSAAEDFTVLIKNIIQYPKFNLRKRNILQHINSTYLKNCTFNRKTDPHCPIFRLGDIVTEAGEDFSVIALKGGNIGIFIDWSCNLDYPERFCIPKYSFSRLDNKNPENNVAPGYNFRYAKYYKNNESIETRTLIKGFGIRFDVIVFGKAGKFHIMPTIVNLGASLTFLSLVNAVCDWFMLTCIKDRDYAKHKFIHLDQKIDGVPLSSMESTSYGTP
ncbi:P2X purinoceptor 4b [Pimephales promelas]|uniref:P2X purinoceptor 4b n=1 Tax=Pimephales promelas TaxID=90988 RepID=UPI001955F4BC|nr:P2X purinoceptor 4b [Pimephales promelas]KAG1973870.1 P2X purinoceptor [Pimephales promelas]